GEFTQPVEGLAGLLGGRVGRLLGRLAGLGLCLVAVFFRRELELLKLLLRAVGARLPATLGSLLLLLVLLANIELAGPQLEQGLVGGLLVGKGIAEGFAVARFGCRVERTARFVHLVTRRGREL